MAMVKETKGTMSYEDRRRFAVGVLKGLDAPVTGGNVLTLLGWMSRENTNAKFNPLATTYGSDGWTAFNYKKNKDKTFALDANGDKQPFVKNYPSFKEGVRSTVLSILGMSKGTLGVHDYSSVVEEFRSGTTPTQFRDNEEVILQLRKWGSFENGDNFGAERTWGYTLDELESFPLDELAALNTEILRPTNGYEFPDPTSNEMGSSSNNVFDEMTGILSDDTSDERLTPEAQIAELQQKMFDLEAEADTLRKKRSDFIEVGIPAAAGEAADETVSEDLGTEGSGALDGFLPIDLPKIPAVMTDEMVNSLYEMYGNADYFLGREDMRIFVGLDGKDIPKGERRVVGGQTITLFPGMNALLYASAMGYTEESQLTNVLEKTEWWKTRRPIERTFDTQWHGLGGDGWENGDEWSIDQNDFLDEESKVLIDMAEDLGLDINLPNIKKMLKDLTYRSKRLGMSEREKKEEFMEIVKLRTDPDRTPGLLEGFEQEITAAGNTWMVDVSEEEKLNLAKKRYYGDITADAVNDILREQSRNMYPSLSSLIDQGYSPEAYFESYKTKGQNILERTLDFMGNDNNMFLKIAGDGPVGTTGLESPMSLASAGDFFRSQNEWRYTNNANDVAYDYADEIITMFGGLGGQARTSGTSSAYNV